MLPSWRRARAVPTSLIDWSPRPVWITILGCESCFLDLLFVTVNSGGLVIELILRALVISSFFLLCVLAVPIDGVWLFSDLRKCGLYGGQVRLKSLCSSKCGDAIKLSPSTPSRGETARLDLTRDSVV